MPTKQNSPVHFDPRAALLLNEAKITITVDLKTGESKMHCNRPDVTIPAMINVLASQICAITQMVIVQSAGGDVPNLTEPGNENKDGQQDGERVD